MFTEIFLDLVPCEYLEAEALHSQKIKILHNGPNQFVSSLWAASSLLRLVDLIYQYVYRTASRLGDYLTQDFGCAMHAGTHQVLLLFKKGASRAIQFPHDGDGELHIAFAIPSAELGNWEAWLQARGIAVEEKRAWESGGWSLYFRDPDRHLIEVATPGTWSVY